MMVWGRWGRLDPQESLSYTAPGVNTLGLQIAQSRSYVLTYGPKVGMTSILGALWMVFHTGCQNIYEPNGIMATFTQHPRNYPLTHIPSSRDHTAQKDESWACLGLGTL